jgi:hypothetical protein
MPEYQTLQFPNTAKGQQEKIRRLHELGVQGWRVAAESITQAQFKTGKAACLTGSGLACCGPLGAPLGLAAGHTDSVITVTLVRD